MENQNTKIESQESKEMLRKLSEELHQDLKQQRYYGMDQKLRNIQKAIALSTRI